MFTLCQTLFLFALTLVPLHKFIEAVYAYQPQAIGMSALLTTTIMEMKNAIHAIEKAGLRKKVKIIVGGAPVIDKFAKEISADAYALDAASVVEVLKSIIAS